MYFFLNYDFFGVNERKDYFVYFVLKSFFYPEKSSKRACSKEPI